MPNEDMNNTLSPQVRGTIGAIGTPVWKGIRFPGFGPRQVTLHPSSEVMVDHIEKHWTTQPEHAALLATQAWAHANAAWHSADALFRALQRDPLHPVWAELVDGYERLVQGAISAATTLGWTTTTVTGARLFFSPQAVLVVVDRGSVRTAFVPSTQGRDDDPGVGGSEATFFQSHFRPALEFIRRAPRCQGIGRDGEYGCLADACDGLRSPMRAADWTVACMRAGVVLSEMAATNQGRKS